MFIAIQIVLGLLLIHAAWIYFFLCGTILQTPRLRGAAAAPAAPGSAEALLRVVVSTASGIAITGFVTFALGLAGLLYPLAFLGWLLVLFALFVVFGDTPLRASFWTIRIAAAREAFSPSALIVYVAAIVLAVPAILPETQSDPLFMHHVLAYEWAQRHEIFVDYWRRFPYYAQNWILIDLWAFEFGLENYVNFLPWLTGCLSLLGVYAYIAMMCRKADVAPGNAWLPGVAGVIGAASLGFSPIFLRWLDTGMIDVPMGLFFFVLAASAAMAYVSDWPAWRLHFVFCAAFFVGLKPSYIVFLPVFMGLAFLLARRFGSRRRVVGGMVLLLVVLSAPWYVKSFVQGGDPIAPALNLAFRGVDSKWSKRDMAALLPAFQGQQGPAIRLRLPLDIVEGTEKDANPENGATGLLLFVALPGFLCAYFMLRRYPLASSGSRSSAFLLAVLLVYAISYWLQTSYIARYSLLFFPVLAAFVPTIILIWCARRRLPMALGMGIILVAAVPASANALSYIQSYWQTNYVMLADIYTDRPSYLASHVDGYSEEEFVSRILLRNAKSSRRVYVVNAESLDYFFARNGITAIGDWFGPERYGDLDLAIDRGDAVRHLRAFNVDAVLVPATAPAVPLEKQRQLFDQLRQAGFTGRILPSSVYHVFFAPGISLR